MAPKLLAVLKLALKQLEAAGPQPQSDADLEDARPGLRQWIERVEGMEQMYPDDLILSLQDVLLDRRGILVAAHLSAANVRTILRDQGFAPLADDYSNDSILDLLVANHQNEYADISKMQERLELLTARDLVGDAGLDWPEDKKK